MCPVPVKKSDPWGILSLQLHLLSDKDIATTHLQSNNVLYMQSVHVMYYSCSHSNAHFGGVRVSEGFGLAKGIVQALQCPPSAVHYMHAI